MKIVPLYHRDEAAELTRPARMTCLGMGGRPGSGPGKTHCRNAMSERKHLHERDHRDDPRAAGFDGGLRRNPLILRVKPSDGRLGHNDCMSIRHHSLAYSGGGARPAIPSILPTLEIIAISTSIAFFPFLPFSGVDPKIQPVLTALPPWCPSVKPGGHIPYPRIPANRRARITIFSTRVCRSCRGAGLRGISSPAEQSTRRSGAFSMHRARGLH